MAFNAGIRSKSVLLGTSVVVAVISITCRRHLWGNQWIYTPEPHSLTGKSILITGGTSGLGLESAKRLAVSGARIILTSRSHEQGRRAVDDVTNYLREQMVTNENVSYKLLRLDDLSAVRHAVDSWNDVDSLDVLLLNAGVMACAQREITVDGYELQFQTNHLGHFLLAALLSPRLVSSARIISVSSAAYKLSFLTGMDFEYVWKPDKYYPWKSYSQSKLANILFIQELQRRADLAKLDWVAVSLHPGTVSTGIGRHFFLGIENYERMIRGRVNVWVRIWVSFMNFVTTAPEQGASTQVWLASEHLGRVQPIKGQYVVENGQVEALWSIARNEKHATRLWSESEHKTNITFAFLRSVHNAAAKT
jgi:NAD(P)-dependent dehydrogenase (short-subunit alcohol dehydrogenase family)